MQKTTTKETVKKVEESTFVKAADLTADIVKDFKKYNVKFLKSYRNQRQLQSISIQIDPVFLNSLIVRPGGRYLTIDKFHSILLDLDVPMFDKRGRERLEWNFEIPVRFVKGNFINVEGEYYSIEIIFKQGVILTHFFDYDQTNIIKALEAQGKVKFEERPDRIDKIEFDELTF